MKIGALHHAASVEFAEDDLFEELFGGQLQQAGADRQDKDGSNSTFKQQAAAFFASREQRRCEFRSQDGDWMRIEGHNSRRHAKFRCQYFQLVQHAGVPAMNTVKVADADAGAAERFWNVNLGHGRGCRESDRLRKRGLGQRWNYTVVGVARPAELGAGGCGKL